MRHFPENRTRKTYVRNFIIILVFSLLVVSCSGLDYLDSLFQFEEVNLGAAQTQEPDALVDSAIIPEATIITVDSDHLTIWLPEQFDPNSGAKSSDDMLGQIESFKEENPEIVIDIRIKAESGSSSLINSLLAASSVAPNALPSVVLLSRAELEIAAEQGILQPIGSLTSVMDEGDWFPYAYKLGAYLGEIIGIPFVGDAVVLATHVDLSSVGYIPIADADRFLPSIAFSAGDPDGIIPFLLYQSSGGVLADSQGQPAVDIDHLTNVLTAIDINRKAGIFSSRMTEYQSDEQLWAAFIEDREAGAYVWASQAVSSEGDYYLSPPPGLGDRLFSYATGWAWCLIRKDASDLELGTAFIEKMTKPGFLAQQSTESAFLPVRPSSMEEWEGSEKTVLAKLLESSELVPGETEISPIKSDMIKAVQEVLLGYSTPEESIQKIVERIEGSE
jgi:multiple sugar transport system substrate-binding protein